MRLGLCCTFLDENIRFRVTTARYLHTLPRADQLRFLGDIALHNVTSLNAAIAWCASHRIGAFRLLSQFFPLATHPAVGYVIEELPNWDTVRRGLAEARQNAGRMDVRLSLHPDQFVVPGSDSDATVKSSLLELEHQATVAAHVGAHQITLHGGGARPTKTEALARLERGLDRLSARARQLIALENDDRVYTVEDLLPVCRRASLPFVYDVHHHRCHPDRLDIRDATALAAETWKGREPYVHLSSPREGWRERHPERHADFIRPRDFPAEWWGRSLTIDVEAKAKEKAVLRLQRWLARQHAAT